MSIELIEGDCREAIRELADNSVDSVVTDPPYALTTTLKRFGSASAKPAQFGKDGAFSRASRGFMGKTWDTGDVAHDPAFWAEVLRVLKPGGHVLAFAGTRTYHRLACAIEDAGFEIRDQIGWAYGSGMPKSHNQHGDWEGWGTALKPAWEPIVMARKPLVGTVAENLEEWRTGAINIDACRVPVDGEVIHTPQGDPTKRVGIVGSDLGITRADTEKFRAAQRASVERANEMGRWPANLIHDGSDEVLAAFPNDAARFFYCPKSSRSDREDGLDESFEKKPLNWSAGTQNPGSSQSSGTDKSARNPHPTVKPTDLMRYLCRLVTPPGGVVLDPFMGSGSTGRGAVLEGFDFVGIEMDASYFDIADARIAAAEKQVAPRQAAE